MTTRATALNARNAGKSQTDKGKSNPNQQESHSDDSEESEIHDGGSNIVQGDKKDIQHEKPKRNTVEDDTQSDEDSDIVQGDKKDGQHRKPKRNTVEDDTQSDEDSDIVQGDKKDGPQQSDPDALHKINPINTYILLILVVSVAVAVILIIAPNNEATFINVQPALDKLFQDFNHQPPRSAKKLRNRVLPYINRTRSPQPFVLLVAAMQENQLAADCFAERVGKIISSKPLKINASSYSNDTGDQVKLDIDKNLRKFFQKGKFPNAAIIYNLNLLPYSTLKLFYAYCDHDNPIFKEVTIIFTVMLPEQYHSLLLTSDEIKKEGVVETFLQEKWSKDENFDENMIGALLSRISDTVIVLSAESKESLEKSCNLT